MSYVAPPPSYGDATGYPSQNPPENNAAGAAVCMQGGSMYTGLPQDSPQPQHSNTNQGFQPQYGGFSQTQPAYPPVGVGGAAYPPVGAGGAAYPPVGGSAYPPPPPPPAGYQSPPRTTDAHQTAPPAGAVAVPMADVEDPNKPDQSYNHWQDEHFAGDSFSDKAIRRAFIRKTYLILVAQLLVTCAFICLFTLHAPTKYWVQHNSWFYYLSYGIFLVLYIALVCCRNVRRKFPVNFICLAIFTLAFSYMTGTISSFYDTNIVLIAIGITAAVCLAISLFAIQTKIDFTMCHSLLFALCMVLFFFGLSCMVVYITIGPSYILQCVYGAVAALVFSLFLAYDTQMIMGGRKYELSPEEYIFGALQLYLDVVYLFLIILTFFGSSSSS